MCKYNLFFIDGNYKLFTFKLFMKTVLFFLIPLLLFSQDEYVGVITLKDNSLAFPFFLKFNTNNNLIDGYSITNYKQSNETKNRITGVVNQKTKEITISEKEVLSTYAEESIDDFCFLTLTLKKEKNSFIGSFIGNYSDGSFCAEGDVFVIKEHKLNQKVKKIKKHIPSQSVAQIDSLMNYFMSYDSVSFIPLTHNQTEIFNFSDSFSISVWDKQKEDGDTITKYVNNECYLKDYCIKNTPYVIDFPYSLSERKIKIIANNIGSISPNSVAIKLSSKNASFFINGRLDSAEYINLIVK